MPVQNPNTPTEFGGERGRIAPDPHDYKDSAYEQHRLMMETDPADPGDTADKALAREQGR